MITVLHGEHTVQSRDALAQALQKAQANKQQIIRLEAKRLTLAELEHALLSTSLFGSDRVIVIEELHSLPNSQRKKELIELIARNQDQDIILCENRALTAVMIKKLGNPINREFKLSKAIFKWLELLGSTVSPRQKLETLQQAIMQDGETFCLIMLIRQVRLLIQVKEQGTVLGSPFMVKKLQQQVRQLTIEQLLALHCWCFELDNKLKSSRLVTPVKHHLEMVTLVYPNSVPAL